MGLDRVWNDLPLPGEYDAMDDCDKSRWRGAIEMAFDLGAKEEREACESAMYDAVCRALDEAGIRNDVLRGMCIEVAAEKFDEMRSNS